METARPWELGGGTVTAKVTRVRVDGVPPEDRFGQWTALLAEAIMSMAVDSDYADRFTGQVTSVQQGRTEVMMFASRPLSGERTRTHIRRADPEAYFLGMVHGSPIGLEQRRNNTLLRAGDMALFDTWHPLVYAFQDQGRRSRLTLVRLPRAAVSLPDRGTDALLGTRLATGTATGALLTAYLSGLRAHAPRAGDEELLRLGAVGFDLVSAFLAAQTDSLATLSAETRHQVLLTRVLTHIDHHLSDPGLGPVSIAARHHISIRLLHQLFRSQPRSVGATVRWRRLERTRADLGDARLRHLTVGEIALRQGFRHPADFSRAFRAAYGMPPSEYRRMTLAPPTS
ncbi:helix-turn-helix domain-containing protein [Streptomyces sp. NPDC047315]|uniref:helix-turn-helix domain-containing protein n=1 Tax=Streptomyces sp. NPDC047315 TaxID=3155142 RepID=UPI0033C4CFAB